MAQRQKPPCCRGLPAPTPPGTSPEGRELKTKHQSPTSPSAAAFYWAEVQEAKHSHTISLLRMPGTPHCYSNILTHHLHPVRWTTLKGLIPEPQSQSSSSTTCCLRHAPSSLSPTNLQQLSTGTTRSAGKKRRVLPQLLTYFPRVLLTTHSCGPHDGKCRQLWGSSLASLPQRLLPCSATGLSLKAHLQGLGWCIKG